MKRMQIAPGAWLSEVPGDKFKRCRVAVHLVAPGRRESATALALLPHMLERRCEAVPDPTELSRLLFSLYGAELSSESYTAGASRVLALTAGGLKNAYALEGEDLAARYLELLCNLLFAPKLTGGVFDAGDLAIEKEKQAEFLRGELNDKRGYCLRQARRKLYGDSPLGIESSGYLEDIEGISPAGLYAEYQELLRSAQVEVMVCGIPAEAAAEALAPRLAALGRAPLPLAEAPPVPSPAAPQEFREPLETVQGKLALMCASGHRDDARGEAVMRLGSALLGGLPTSRLFRNVREKQSLCYYCASSYGFFGGTLSMDSGVDHDKAGLAAKAMLAELAEMQKNPVSAEELAEAKLYMRGVFSAAKDSPDALINWAFTEWLKGTHRGLDEMSALMETVGAGEIRDAMAAFAPAVEYILTEKGAGA